MFASKGRLHFKIKVNRTSRIRDMSDQIFFFVFFFSSFRTNHKIASNLQVHTLIRLKFGTPVGCILANSSTNFDDSIAKIYGVTGVYLHIQKLNFGHAHRVNCCFE